MRAGSWAVHDSEHTSHALPSDSWAWHIQCRHRALEPQPPMIHGYTDCSAAQNGTLLCKVNIYYYAPYADDRLQYNNENENWIMHMHFHHSSQKMCTSVTNYYALYYKALLSTRIMYHFSGSSGDSLCHNWLHSLGTPKAHFRDGHSTSEVCPLPTIGWLECSAPQQTQTAVSPRSSS